MADGSGKLTGSWTVAEAKAKFSELVDKARSEGPQLITKNGRPSVMVVSEADWAAAAKPAKSVHDVLYNPKYRGLLSDEDMKLFERDRDVGRPPIEF